MVACNEERQRAKAWSLRVYGWDVRETKDSPPMLGRRPRVRRDRGKRIGKNE